MMINQINHAGELWWSWMWPMFWQVGVLIGLVTVIDLLLRRRVWPQVRYALWLLVLAKLMLPPTFSLSTSVTSGLEPIAEQIIRASIESEQPHQSMQTTLPYIDVSSPPIVIPPDSAKVESSQPVGASEGAAIRADRATPAVKTAQVSAKGWAMCVWVLGVAVLSVWLAARFRHLRRCHAAKGDGLALPDWLSESVAESAKKLKLRRLPGIVVSKDIASPAVFGILRPTLLLPSRHLAKGLQKDTEHVLLHELAHIKRGDLWVHAVYMVLQIVHWFNPLLWLVRRRLQHLRELCCDASVAWILRERTSGYRQTILDTAKRLLARPIEPGIGLLGLFEDSSRLLIRLKWLEKKTWRYRTLRIAIILALITFMTACILPMAKGGDDVKLSAEELVAKIIENEKEIRNVELHYDYVHKDGYVGASFDWGYQYPKEYSSCTSFSRAEGGHAAFTIKQYKAFDGLHARTWREEVTYRDSRIIREGLFGTIAPLRPGGSLFAYPRPIRLLGHDMANDRRSFGEVLREAENLAIKSCNQEIGGHECYLLEALGVRDVDVAKDIRVWIDPHRGFRPLRVERYESTGGKNRWKILRKVIDNINLEKINGVWFPLSGSSTSHLTKDRLPPEGMSRAEFAALPAAKRRQIGTYTMEPSKGSPVSIRVARESVRINEGIAAEKFAPEFPEGCKVYDKSNGKEFIVGDQSEPSESMKRNWANFRGAGGGGICADAGIPDDWDGPSGKGILWKNAVLLPGNSSPVVWGDRVFVSGGKGDKLGVYCYAGSSGRLLWTGDVPMTRPKAGEKFEVLKDTGLAAPTMATDGERVFAIFASGDLGCFDFSGRRLWTKMLGIPDNVYGHASSLAIYRNLVVVQLDQGKAEDGKSRLMAFNASSGGIVWEQKRPVRSSWASPIVTRIGGTDALITCSDPWVIAHAPAGGNELWRAKCLKGDIAVSAVCTGGMTFVVEPYSKIVAIRADGRGDVTKTHIAWSVDESGPDICSPVTNGKFVFFLNSDGLALCLNAADGRKLWEQDIKEEFSASPSLVGDKLYLLTEKGEMIIAEGGPEYKELKRCKLGEGCRASPAFADGKIYIRGLQNLYCIGEDETASALPRAFEEAIDGKDDESAVRDKSEWASIVRVKVLDHRGEAVKDATVELQLFAGGDVDDEENYSTRRVETDSDGLCVFEDITAVSGTVGRSFTSEGDSFGGIPYGLWFRFEIERGKDYDITLGGKGRPVTGRLVPASGTDGDIDWSKARLGFELRTAPMAFIDLDSQRLMAMKEAEGGDFYRKSPVKVNPDGTFRIENVRAGLYMLRVKVPEEPKSDRYNLFREIRIPLMAGGTSDKVFNLGTLAVTYAGHTAPRHIDNLFLDALEFDKDIPVILKAGNDEQPEVVSAKSVKFAKSPQAITAALDIEWKQLVAERWRARLTMLGKNGSHLVWDDVFFETSKIIGKYLHPTKETLSFSFSGELDLSGIPRFLITIRPVSEILTGTQRAQSPAAIGAAGREGGLKGDFDELSVKFGGIWLRPPGGQFTIKPDGAVELSAKRPNSKIEYVSNFKLRSEHLTQLVELLKKTNGLTAPGANVHPGYTDATRIDITLTRDDEVRKVWCHDRNPEPYLSLVNFLKRIYNQESLLYRMVADGGKDRTMAFFDLGREIRAQEGEPTAVNPNHALDLNRFVPPSMDVIDRSDDNHHEAIKTALELLGKLHIEQARERITYLTTAEQKARGRSGASYCTEFVQSAAVEALTNLGGEQARMHIQGMAVNHASWQRKVNEAVVEGLLILDRDGCFYLLKNMVPESKRASWGLIRLGPPAIPSILEVLQSRDLRNMGPIYLIRQYIENWEKVPKPIDPRVIEAVQKNLDYRLGSTTTWTEYHKEFLKLANAPELPGKDARQVAEAFLVAVKADDLEKMITIIKPVQTDWSERFAKLKALPHLQKLIIKEVLADAADNIAWAVAGAPADDEKSQSVRIILNFVSGSVWRVGNIAIETPQIYGRMAKRYLESHPNAKPVPAKSPAPSADADTEKPEEAWGEPIAGVQSRIRLPGRRKSWREDEIPRLIGGIRKEGSDELFARWAQDGCQLEVNGQWYSWSGRTAAELMSISAGNKLDYIFISLSSLWRTVDGRELRFTPGKHTVRLAVPAFLDKGEVLSPIQPISNPVQIEITPVGDIDLAWGKEVNGLRAAVEFSPDKPAYFLGDSVDLRFHIQNVSNETVQFVSESWLQEQNAIIRDPSGNLQIVSSTWISGIGPIDRYYLKPNEKVIIDSYDLGIGRDDKQAREFKHAVGYRLRCKEGVYYAHFALRFPNVETSLLPVEHADFKGTLETGRRKFAVTSESDVKPVPVTFPEGVVDRSLSMGKRQYLDLDTGMYVSMEGGDASDVAVLKAGCVDLYLTYESIRSEPPHAQVKAFGMAVRDVPHVRELGPSAREAVAEALAITIAQPGESKWVTAYSSSGVWAFRTAEGRAGVLRIEWPSAGEPPQCFVQYTLLPQLDIPIEESKWGEAVRGVQCRLRPLRSAWRSDTPPELSLDIRNNGAERIDFCRIAEAHCEIEIDGRWYGLAEPLIIDAPVWELKPGMELNDAIKVKLTDSWALPKAGGDPPHAPGRTEKWGKRLELTAGKHTARVRFRPHDWLEGYMKKESNLSAVSNYVGVESFDAGEEDALWGEAVEGLRVRLRAREPVELTPTATFRMDIRNHSENEYRLVLTPSTWDFKLDGKTYRGATSHRGEPPMLVIGPREEHKGLLIPLDKEYGWQCGDEPLRFIHGRHTFAVTVKVDRLTPGGGSLRVSSKPIELEVSSKVRLLPTWSRHAEGFQIRAFATKYRWQTGQTPIFEAQLRNLGPHSALIPLIYHNAWEVEVDGKWHHCSIRNTALPHPLTPYTQYDNIPIELSPEWRAWIGSTDKLGLKLDPGLHEIRIGLPLGCKTIEGEDKLLQLVSEPFEIEIMRDTPKADELIWGEAVNGLRAAVEFIPEKPSYAFGAKIGLRFHFQNVSDKDIQFVSDIWRQEQKTIVEDVNGNHQGVSYSWYSGWTPVERYYLKPGETTAIDSSAFGIAANNEQADKLGHPVGHEFICIPGTYFVRFPLIIPNVKSSTVPEQEQDFHGTVETGKRKLVVADAASTSGGLNWRGLIDGFAGKLKTVAGKGSVVEVDPNAGDVLRRYGQALEQSDWDAALAFCSNDVRKEAAKYPSAEAFFRAVVPVEKVLAQQGRPRTGYWPNPPKYFAYFFDVRIPQPGFIRDVWWVWKVRRLDGQTKWEIDFPVATFESWLAKEKDQIERAAKELDQRKKALAPKFEGVKTVLSAESGEFVIGEPVYLNLHLVNEGTSLVRYDDQQVAANNSLTITGPDGREVEYVAPLFQTMGVSKKIEPGQTKMLFERFDITEQYALEKPGQYRIQFSGRGLQLGALDEDKIDLEDPTSFLPYPDKLPSNVITITIRSSIPERREAAKKAKEDIEALRQNDV